MGPPGQNLEAVLEGPHFVGRHFEDHLAHPSASQPDRVNSSAFCPQASAGRSAGAGDQWGDPMAPGPFSSQCNLTGVVRTPNQDDGQWLDSIGSCSLEAVDAPTVPFGTSGDLMPEEMKTTLLQMNFGQ